MRQGTLFVRCLVLCASLWFAAVPSHALIIILNPDLGQSTPPPGWGGSVANTLDDPFAYNPTSPTSPMPDTEFSSDDGYHGLTVGDITIAFTMSQAYDNLFLDLYGRDQFPSRDNNLTIQFFNGSWAGGSMTEQFTGFDVNDATLHGRVTATSTTWADRFQITRPFPLPNGDQDSGNNYFTMMEVRANGIPEPSSAMLLLAGASAMVMRRTRRS